jgi:hypothetical protein
MNKLEMNIAFWLSGVIAGAVAMERWRRRGLSEAVDGEAAPEPADPTTPSATSPSAATKDKVVTVSQSIIAGARSDARRLRSAAERVVPFGRLPGTERAVPPQPATSPAP